MSPTIDRPPIIYLNNAATTWPKPPGVLAAITQSLALPVFGSGRTTGSQGEDYVALAREAIASLLAADPPEHVVFTSSATDSLNILIQGFLAGCDLRPTAVSSRPNSTTTRSCGRSMSSRGRAASD
ncbi:MAG TPA: aminotransferase class V-fold PLP-dependent enzyme [Methanoculleus sp.]|nr:aminotransferase class V-fold PLP-dependent enzyme [Methanoculleus sp.]